MSSEDSFLSGMIEDITSEGMSAMIHDDDDGNNDEHKSKKTRLTGVQGQISRLLSFLDKGEREKRSQKRR
jgi:hypothetical protein